MAAQVRQRDVVAVLIRQREGWRAGTGSEHALTNRVNPSTVESIRFIVFNDTCRRAPGARGSILIDAGAQDTVGPKNNCAATAIPIESAQPRLQTAIARAVLS